METWKKVTGYLGDYEVSDLGRVRRIDQRRCWACHQDRGPRITIIGGTLDKGYRRVAMRLSPGRKGKVKLVGVHALVVRAFLGECDGYRLVPNHKNGVRNDNRLENLEIVTRQQNSIHSVEVLKRTSLKGIRHGRSKLTEEQVKEIRSLGEKREWGIGTKLAKQFGVGPQIISFILNRRNWKHI